MAVEKQLQGFAVIQKGDADVRAAKLVVYALPIADAAPFAAQVDSEVFKWQKKESFSLRKVSHQFPPFEANLIYEIY